MISAVILTSIFMAFFSILKQGQIYLNTWPQEAKLGIIFPENRIMKVTSFAQKFMPFVAVFAVVWQQIYAKNDLMAFSIAILTALFANKCCSTVSTAKQKVS